MDTSKPLSFNFNTPNLIKYRWQKGILHTFQNDYSPIKHFSIMNFNILVVLATGFIPLILGFLWANPKTLGNARMKEADMDEDKMKGANMMMIFGVSLVLGMMLALDWLAVIHQNHLYRIDAQWCGESG